MTDTTTVFQERVVDFLNGLCRRRNLEVVIGPETHLFETKILDSVQFLELMTFLQADLGVDVPDRKLSVEFFLTPRIITDNFAAPAPEGRNA
jgi:acyl carrier protein